MNLKGLEKVSQFFNLIRFETFFNLQKSKVFNVSLNTML